MVSQRETYKKTNYRYRFVYLQQLSHQTDTEQLPSATSLTAGDAEGANEMTYSMGFLRQFCRSFQQNAAATRIFFPDKQVRCNIALM